MVEFRLFRHGRGKVLINRAMVVAVTDVNGEHSYVWCRGMNMAWGVVGNYREVAKALGFELHRSGCSGEPPDRYLTRPCE